jgi:hypothetical protein
LNARASQAWRDYDPDADMSGSTQAAFEEGWETGYKAAREDVRQAVEWLRRRAKDEACGTADTRWAYKRAADFMALEIGAEVSS